MGLLQKVFMSKSAMFKSEGQTEEGCQRQKSSGAFQMLYRGCEFILLKSKTIFLNTKQPQCQQVTFVSRVGERTLGEAYTHKQCHSVCLVYESLSATRHTVYATLIFFLRFFFFYFLHCQSTLSVGFQLSSSFLSSFLIAPRCCKVHLCQQ